MAGRSHYSEAEKANVYVVLKANNDNVKRTARETGTPENTVRRWRDEWKKNGPPGEEAVTAAADSFLKDAERVRNAALVQMEAKLPEAKVGELNAVVGTLTDKINLIRGAATSRQEHTMALPSADQVKQMLGPAIRAAIEMAEIRQDEIIDAEVVEEHRLLPAPQGATPRASESTL